MRKPYEINLQQNFSCPAPPGCLWVLCGMQGGSVMFTKKEQRLLSAPYFRLIRQTAIFYEVQSWNTGHCWIIQKPYTSGDSSVHIYHKHTLKTPYYHRHGQSHTVQSAVQQTKSHDASRWTGGSQSTPDIHTSGRYHGGTAPDFYYRNHSFICWNQIIFAIWFLCESMTR